MGTLYIGGKKHHMVDIVDDKCEGEATGVFVFKKWNYKCRSWDYSAYSLEDYKRLISSGLITDIEY